MLAGLRGSGEIGFGPFEGELTLFDGLALITVCNQLEAITLHR